MQSILAITCLTWKAAFRFRLFLVLATLLLASVIGLPLLIKDDGTARGFTQILITYTLSTITALLGLSTLWLACGTLARDIEEGQMQMVAVKPVARWQIWLGKWFGLISLNAALLALSGGGVYGLLLWRSSSLPPDQQRVLRTEVLIARGTARQVIPASVIEEQTEQRLKARLEQGGVDKKEIPLLRQQYREMVKADYQIVEPGYFRIWHVNLASVTNDIQGQPLFLRLKFNAASASSGRTYTGVCQVGDPEKGRAWRSEPMSLAAETPYEFEVPSGLCDEKGVLTISFANLNDTSLLFPMEDGMEVLYQESGFLANYIRALCIILCWMALLAALGLAASSFLSFPVAAFASCAALILVFSTGTLSGAIEDGTLMGVDSESGTVGKSVLDPVAVPAFKAILTVINLAKDFSPVDALSSGRSVSWTVLAAAFVRVVLLMGGVLAVIGIATFSKRELARAQGTQ